LIADKDRAALMLLVSLAFCFLPLRTGAAECAGAAAGVALQVAAVDRVGGVPSARVRLSLHDQSGALIWQNPGIAADAGGRVAIQAAELPALLTTRSAVVAVEAPNHLAAKIDLEATKGSEGTVSFVPCRVTLVMQRVSPALTILILIPGIVGFVFAVLRTWEGSKRWNRFNVTYALAVTVAWCAVSLFLCIDYALRGDGLFGFFWEDLKIPTGLVVITCLGSLVYVAYAIYEKPEGFYRTASELALRKIQRTLAGRILVAPYVAMVAWAVFTPAFPSLQSGAYAMFLGFFTGLFIKPVLEALNGIGMRLVSRESQEKVAQRMMTATNAGTPGIPSGRATLQPDAGFVRALTAARAQLVGGVQQVVGIMPGTVRGTDGGSTVAVVALIHPGIDPALVTLPPIAGGLPVVGRSFGDRLKLECAVDRFDIAWRKLDTGPSGEPADVDIQVVGQTLVLADDTLFSRGQYAEYFDFDPRRAYLRLQPRYPGRFDFVSFIVAYDSWDDGHHHYLRNYSHVVFNDVANIGHFRGDSYDERGDWGNDPRLRACQVLSLSRSDKPFRRQFLHELAHTWCAYAPWRDPETGQVTNALQLATTDQGQPAFYHWRWEFDDGRSCLDYDREEWQEISTGQFESKRVDDADFGYCELDLYLMGLLPAAQVRPMRLLRDLTLVNGPANRYTARPVTFGIENVQQACGGERRPAYGSAPAHFRQAFVVISATPDAGKQLAESVVEPFRSAFERHFSEATGGRGSLDTSLG